jgi:hypothetical protein
MPDTDRPFHSEPPPWAVHYFPQKKIVIATGTGPITDSDAQGQARAAIASLKENGTNLLLVDYAETFSEMSFAILYWLPRFDSELTAPHKTRIAVVLPRSPHCLETFELYALACNKTGHSLKLFANRKAAEGWLQEQGRV